MCLKPARKTRTPSKANLKNTYLKDFVGVVQLMSKYTLLWNWIKENGTDRFKLTYAEIERITGFPIDHSFLTYKKELSEYGYRVGKISTKEQTVLFERVAD